MSLPEGFVAPTQFSDTGNPLVKKPTTGALGTQVAQFRELQVYDENASKQAGREMYRTEEVCLIRNDKFSTVPIKVKDLSPKLREELAPLYQAFLERKEMLGTPIDEWAAVSESDAISLMFSGLKTVEQVAALEDHELHVLGSGAKATREKARMHIRSKDETKPSEETVMQLMQENKNLLARMNDLEAEIARHAAIAAASQSSPKKDKKDGNVK